MINLKTVLRNIIQWITKIFYEFKLDRNLNSRSWPKWLTELE